MALKENDLSVEKLGIQRKCVQVNSRAMVKVTGARASPMLSAHYVVRLGMILESAGRMKRTKIRDPMVG